MPYVKDKNNIEGYTKNKWKDWVYITEDDPKFVQYLATKKIADKLKSDNAVIERELAQLDSESISLIREFIVKKFKTDADLPQELVDLDADVKTKKGKLK